MSKTKVVLGVIVGIIVMSLFLYLVMPNGETKETYQKSDYTKCVEASQDMSCELEILKSMGYDDGVDCIQDDDNSICDFDRYNAQVDASNECFGQKPNIFDCMELLK